jgi:hypothetical protein
MPAEKLNNIDPDSGQAIIAENDPNYRAGYGTGVLNEAIVEPLPKRITTDGETVINRGNSWIVLGRDRPASRASGFGGSGATQASAIDLVVGMGALDRDEPEYADPNFKGDSARIYISQRSNIDDAFNITSERASDIGNQKNQSAIGMKADSVRIIGTNGIKLLTRMHNRDSRGGLAAYNGIELVAGGRAGGEKAEEQLQYMVKGENLVDALSELEDRIVELYSIVLNFLKAQIQVNAAIASHNHMGTGVGGNAGGPIATVVTTAPSFTLPSTCVQAIQDAAEGMVDNMKGRTNMNINWHNKYLVEASSNYILSKYNKVN